MQHTAKGKPKIVDTCTLPLTSARPVDMLVSEMAVIVFPEGKATLLETGPGVAVEQVVAATEAKLVLPAKIPQMQV
jgi:acetate CoA/acetoacetate CoA-transferase beta subunit